MEIARETFEKLQQMVNRVVKSPRSDFYRRKFAKENFDYASPISSGADIIRIPRLTRAELAETPPFERLYSTNEHLDSIRYTSGTTGSPPILLFRAKVNYGIPGRRPLILFQNSHVDAYNARLSRSAQEPYFPPLIGHPGNTYTVTAALAKAYKIDAIIGIPSRILALAIEMDASSRNKTETIFIVGERFTNEHKRILVTSFPHALLDIRYGMSELGCPGYQCDILRKKTDIQYHCDENYLLEFTDLDTGAWKKENTEGEIVVTELSETPHQLIRYRTGDAGRVVNDTPCACGAAFAFEVTGRINHDIIKISGMMFRTDEIERVIKEFPEIEENFRGVVETRQIGTDKEEIHFSLTIVLKQKEGIHPYFLEQLEQNFSERFFLTPSKTLADCIQEKRISSFDVFAIESFPFETKAQCLRLIER